MAADRRRRRHRDQHPARLAGGHRRCARRDSRGGPRRARPRGLAVTPAPAAQGFDGRCAVVTGVGRAGQVGEVVAREFARRGASVAIIDRDGAAAESLAAAMRADGLAVAAYGGDLTDTAATTAAFTKIAAAAGGRIHALANVAGGFAMSGPLAESDPAVFQRQLSINLGSAYG